MFHPPAQQLSEQAPPTQEKRLMYSGCNIGFLGMIAQILSV
jgi:hypothetical protein